MVLSREVSKSTELRHKGFNGYLICSKCNGYYELQEGESPLDFGECECGGGLKFNKSLPRTLSREYNPLSNDLTGNIPNDLNEYEELQEIVAVLKNKAHKRKKLLENLSNRISVQEEILNEIQSQRWDLWDHLGEKNLQNDIDGQKELLENIVGQEDNLLSHIKEHRAKTGNIGDNSNINSFKL